LTRKEDNMLRLRPRSLKETKAPGDEEDSAPPPLAILEFQSPTAAILAMPMPLIARYTGMWITGLVFTLLIVAAIMPVDKIVSASGVLVSSAPITVVQTFNTSIVKQINVQSGQIVHKGDVLATLDPTYAAADLTALTAQQQAYSAQVAQLHAQEYNTPYTPDAANPSSQLQIQTYNQQMSQYNFTIEDYEQKIKALQSAITGYNQQVAYYQQRLAVASNVETMRKSLQQLQVGSKLDTLAATDDRINLQAELASAQSSAVQSERDLAAQEAERDTFIQQWKANISQQLSEAINNLTQAEQSLAKAKLNDQLVVLTAPVDSIVQSVAQASVGSVTQSGTVLMNLVPINAPLSVQVEIDGSNSGYVSVGDEAVIKFNTLPFLEYGSAKGVVQSVSPDSINPQEQTANSLTGAALPGGPQDLFYQATVSLDEVNLHNVPDGFRLVPGMPLSADVKVGTHSVLSYFTQRIMPVAYNSLHEP
jgi:hemolysin D